MILIKVDLPAPLSPSSPSTSPFFRCRLTSRRAVTGPKRFAMCSTRRTSSGAEVGGTITSGGGAWSATAVPSAHASNVHVLRHRHDHRETGVEEQVVGVHPLQDHTLLEDTQEHGADQGAKNSPPA